MRVPILSGPLRGSWWLLTSPGQSGLVLTGRYEQEHTRLFGEWIEPGAQVIDVGAHVGYYTILSARLAGPSGRVWAFEPNPRNHAYLRRHVRINRLGNVECIEVAVADHEGSSAFEFGSGSGTGHLASSGPLQVETMSLDGFCRARGVRPDLIKIDAEGAEDRVLAGARDVLARARPVIVLSTHGPDLHERCVGVLRDHDYMLTPITGSAVEMTTELLCTPG